MNYPQSIASLLLVMLLSTLAQAAPVFAKECSQQPESYEREGYTVHEVRVETPLGWLFGSITDRLRQILTDPSMPIKGGDPYRKANADAGFIKLTAEFPELNVGRVEPVAVRIAKPGLDNCDQDKKTLDVVYHVYTFALPYYQGRAFEKDRREEVKRSVVDTPSTKRLANFFPQPFAGYNRSRGVFGGSTLTIQQATGPFDAISLSGSGSSSSSEAQVEATGAKDRSEGFIRHFEYRFGYLYSHIPSNDIALTESSGLGEAVLASRALGAHDLILRFGGSIEGGRKRSSLDPGAVPATDLVSSGYGSVKVFIGGTMTAGGHALKASYGLQLGNAEDGKAVDYIKQVVDLGANLRFLPRDHRPISVDLRFNAGAIDIRGRLPVAERFIGGNVAQNFIATNTWVIGSEPFIRSFPQNSFDRATTGGPIGGNRFFSTNVTVAATVWGKPLVPTEILSDPDFPNLVALQFSVAESSLRNEYLSGTPEFRQVAEMVNPLATVLTAIGQELDSIQNQNPAQDIRDQVSLCRTDLQIASNAADSIKQDLAGGSPKTADVRKLVVGFPDKSPPITAYASDLVDDLTTLRDMPDLPGPNRVAERIVELETSRQQMAAAFTAVDQGPVAKRQAQRAERDMKYPRRVFNELTHEANLVAVSPVGIFDAARLWQSGLPAGDVRYAVGGGLRLSIVSLDVTAGYAWNPTRRPGESRGALLFSMDVSNLFR